MRHVICVFAEEFYKHLNISSNAELDHILKCLAEDKVEEEENIDVQKLCENINFNEEILETTPTLDLIPLSDITLGDELNLSNIIDDNDMNNILTSNLNMPTFDLNFDIDELLYQPTDLSTQEVNQYMNNFLEQVMKESK